jgi:hypothetical protein
LWERNRGSERERETGREQEREKREKYAMVKFVGRGTPEDPKRYHFV